MKKTFVEMMINEIYILRLKYKKTGYDNLKNCKALINLQDFIDAINKPINYDKYLKEEYKLTK